MVSRGEGAVRTEAEYLGGDSQNSAINQERLLIKGIN